MKKKIFVMLVSLMVFCCFFSMNDVKAATATSDLTMVMKSGSYTYSTTTAISKYRKDYLSFGEDIKVVSISGDWATIINNGNTEYVLKKNIDYKKDTVIKNRIMVSPGPYACSSKSTLGYLFYGTDVSVIEEVTSKKGVTYVHVLIEKTFEEDGKTIKNTNVEGYINKAYLEEKNTPKVVKVTTNLYASAFGSTATDAEKTPVGTIYVGENVQVLMSNPTWSKVNYNGKEYYIYTDKLDHLKLQILANRVVQTFDAKPGSGFLHYVYWNTPITVINEYHSDIYGKYYYCNISGDYGFIREFSNSGIQYVGYQTQMNTNNRVNLYQIPEDTSNKIMTIDVNKAVTILYQNETWTYVDYNGTKGYVLTRYLEYPTYYANGKVFSSSYRLYKKTGNGNIKGNVQLIAKKDKYGFAYVKDANGKYYWMNTKSLSEIKNEVKYTVYPFTTLHIDASNDSESLFIPYMSEVEILGVSSESAGGKWIKVKYQQKPYYVWINTGVEYFTNQKHSLNYSYSTTYEKEAIEKALYIYNNWDTKYVHGQSNGVMDKDGKYGFDCSGFVSYVLDTVMTKYVPTYNLSANLEALMNTQSIYNKGYNGELVAKTILTGTINENLLKPGDAIYFDIDMDGVVDHVGMYLGNGEFVHCSSSWDGKMTIMPLTDIYKSTFVCARRYLPENAVSANQKMITTSGKTKIYSQKSDQSPVLITLTKDYEVVLHYTDNQNWAYVQYNDTYGYVLAKYLKK